MDRSSPSTASLDGFADLYRAYFARTVRVVRPIVGAFAEDVAQEAFVAALGQWDHVAGLQSPGSWVCFVARRMARRRAHRDAVCTDIGWAGDIDLIGRSGVDLDVRAAVRELPSRQRDAILLRYFVDRSMDEVAALLHCREPAARVLMHRARQRLAEPLSGLSGVWMGERRWTADLAVRQLESTGDGRYRDAIVANVGCRHVRRVLTLSDGDYFLANDDGERLDYGTFSLRGGVLDLTPWNDGAVVFRTSIDGDVVRFKQLSNTTPATDGVPDHVYVRFLLESEPLVWRGPSDGAAIPRPDRASPA